MKDYLAVVEVIESFKLKGDYLYLNLMERIIKFKCNRLKHLFL